MNNLYTLFETSIDRYAPRLAIQFRPRYRTLAWTYGELGAHVAHLSRALEAKGIGPGDRVLLYAGNSPYWVAAYFGILARGAIVVPLNPQGMPDQLDRIVASAEPKLLLISTRPPWPAKPVPWVRIDPTRPALPVFLLIENMLDGGLGLKRSAAHTTRLQLWPSLAPRDECLDISTRSPLVHAA